MINIRLRLSNRLIKLRMKNKIREIRKRKRLSQKELAKLSKVSRQTIATIENNLSEPHVSLAFKLAKILDVPLDTLFIHD